MGKWISLDEKKPKTCETIIFSNGENIFTGWLETHDFGEELIFYAFADVRGKTEYKLETYWPDDVQWWMPFPKLPKKEKNEVDKI